MEGSLALVGWRFLKTYLGVVSRIGGKQLPHLEIK